LALAARDAEELERAKSLLAPTSQNVFTFVCDVTDREIASATVAKVCESCGPVEILFNVAGIIECGPEEVQTLEDYEKSMNTHFWGPLFMTQACLPAMKQKRFGRVVNISSIAGLVSVPHLLPYSASKHALAGLSQGWRTEFLKHNIFVTTVCPGLMRTGSPVNADMKGHNRVEYALFSLLDALPLTSIDSATAAEQIVRACKYGDANLIISFQAKAVHLLHAIVPNLTEDLLGLTNALLPGEGGIGLKTAIGKESESFVSPSLLTKLSDDAAQRNNEVA
jgi:NAD(P)-dependent dehydrogenase (short-subunit alcohol dehydrogenase family)